MSPKQKYNELLAQRLIGEFEKRNMQGFYCKTKEEALCKVLELMPQKSVVSCGGSLTLDQMGFRQAMRESDYTFLDPRSQHNVQEMEMIAHKALNADYYLMSANAITLTGELVNADGIGNRVAALAYGAKNVIVVAGLNKVEPDLDTAILRIKTKSSQLCMLMYKTDFDTFDMLEEASKGVISQLVVTSMSIKKNRIKVILVEENLGL